MSSRQAADSRRVRAHRTLIAVVCFVFALAGPAAARSTRHHRRPVASCAKAKTPATTTNIAAMRAAVLCLVNAQRTSRGLPALREDPRLDRSAQGWSRSMVAGGVFSHGTDFAARITAAGFAWSAAGENIATGYPTPAAVVAGWMASLGHCRNILAPDYSAIGIGMVAKPVRGYASGPATWTEDFGLPMGHHAPSRNGAPAAGCPY
jgi:uncharacterized protein YkwD